MKFERSRMTKDDVLFGYRLQVFDLAGRTSVSHACRVFGIHRSTYYAWKAQVDQGGLEMLRPKERRRPQMPNQLSAVVEERKWGALVVSPNGVYNALRRHGLNTRKLRLSLVAGYRAPYEPPRQPPPEPHIDVERPGELVGIDCFKVGKLRGTEGEVWQLTAIDLYSSYGWAELVACPSGNPSHHQTSKLARRIAAELSAAGWALERVLTDNGNEFQASFHQLVTDTLGARHTRIRSGRPQTNGHVERLHRTILEECWRPAFARYVYVRLTGLRHDLHHYLHTYNHDRVHHGRLTQGRIPADIVHAARKMEPR
jgi:transposase InsO family protein